MSPAARHRPAQAGDEEVAHAVTPLWGRMVTQVWREGHFRLGSGDQGLAVPAIALGERHRILTENAGPYTRTLRTESRSRSGIGTK